MSERQNNNDDETNDLRLAYRDVYPHDYDSLEEDFPLEEDDDDDDDEIEEDEDHLYPLFRGADRDVAGAAMVSSLMGAFLSDDEPSEEGLFRALQAVVISEEEEQSPPHVKCPLCLQVHDYMDPKGPNMARFLFSHDARPCFVDSFQCPICLEIPSEQPMVALACGHVVCQEDFQQLGGEVRPTEQCKAKCRGNRSDQRRPPQQGRSDRTRLAGANLDRSARTVPPPFIRSLLDLTATLEEAFDEDDHEEEEVHEEEEDHEEEDDTNFNYMPNMIIQLADELHLAESTNRYHEGESENSSVDGSSEATEPLWDQSSENCAQSDEGSVQTNHSDNSGECEQSATTCNSSDQEMPPLLEIENTSTSTHGERLGAIPQQEMSSLHEIENASTFTRGERLGAIPQSANSGYDISIAPSRRNKERTNINR